jgi:hypothetical protein
VQQPVLAAVVVAVGLRGRKRGRRESEKKRGTFEQLTTQWPDVRWPTA